MKFYMLRNTALDTADVYVNGDAFNEAVSAEIDQRLKCVGDDVTADEVERQVHARTHTCTSLAEVDRMVGNDAVGNPDWREAGRGHDGTPKFWRQADYRLGNAQLYRLAAESLRTAEDETMAYDQGRFHDPGIAEALSLHRIPAESRIVTDEMAAGIAPCETAACVAGHVYVCARGWRDYLSRCVQATEKVPTSEIGNTAAAELGMSDEQHCALFPAQPVLHEVVEAFGIRSEDWSCPPARREEITKRWNWKKQPSDYLAADMAVVLETIARRCDRVNALAATIDN